MIVWLLHFTIIFGSKTCIHLSLDVLLCYYGSKKFYICIILLFINVGIYLPLDVLLCYYASQNFYMSRILLFMNIVFLNFNFVHMFCCVLSQFQSPYIAYLLVLNCDCILVWSYPILLSFAKCLHSHLSLFDVVKRGEIMLMYNN